MKVFNHFIFFSCLCFNTIFPNNINAKPNTILNFLHDNTGWEILDSSANRLISTKRIPGKDLFAVMVQKELDLPKEILQAVIMDINNYKQFLKSSDSFISNEINAFFCGQVL